MNRSLRLPVLVCGCLLAVGACNATAPASPSVNPTTTPSATHTTSPTATAQPTGTRAPTQPPTPAPTPTRAPSTPTGGPSAAPGNVIFSDDFSGTTKYLSAGIQAGSGGGQYVNGVFDLVAQPQLDLLNFREGTTIQSCAGDGCAYPDVVHDQLATATVEVDAILVSGSTGGPFGIACHYSGGGYIGGFYGLTISADGRQYAVSHFFSASGDLPIALLLGGSSRGDLNPLINAGIGASNHLRADCGQQVLSLSVNGQVVASATLPEPYGSSTSGIALIAAPGPGGQVDVQFDNLVVRELSAEPAALEVQGVAFGDALTSDDGVWPTGDLGSGTAAFTNNAYRLTIPDPSQYQVVYPSAITPPSDTSTQIDATFVAGSQSSLMGLVCRSGSDGYYVLQVAPVGQFSLYRATESGAMLVNWTQSSAIKTGAGQTNTIRLDCVGDTLTAYANGTQIAQATDSVLSDGDAGFGAVSAPAEGGTVYDFNNFVVSYPQP